MRWKTKQEKKPEYKKGSKRTEEVFAFLPVDLSDGNTVWLESYVREWLKIDGKHVRLPYVKEIL